MTPSESQSRWYCLQCVWESERASESLSALNDLLENTTFPWWLTQTWPIRATCGATRTHCRRKPVSPECIIIFLISVLVALLSSMISPSFYHDFQFSTSPFCLSVAATFFLCLQLSSGRIWALNRMYSLSRDTLAFLDRNLQLSHRPRAARQYCWRHIF